MHFFSILVPPWAFKVKARERKKKRTGYDQEDAMFVKVCIFQSVRINFIECMGVLLHKVCSKVLFLPVSFDTGFVPANYLSETRFRPSNFYQAKHLQR